MLGELEVDDSIVISDLEAGVGTVLRVGEDVPDVIVVVAEPTAKSVGAAQRAAAIASGKAHVIVVANRISSDEDLELIRASLGEHEMVVVPEDPGIAQADKDGVAPIDSAPGSPGVQAIIGLAELITEVKVPS